MFGSHFNLDIFGLVSLVSVYQRKYLVCQWSVDYHMCAYQDDNNNQDRMQRLKQETNRQESKKHTENVTVREMFRIIS